MTELQIPPDARRTRTCIIFRDRFLRMIFVDRAEVGIEDAREAIAISSELFGSGPALPVNADLRRLRSQTAEARAFLAAPEGILVTPGLALVIASPVSRMIGNFFLGLNRPICPTRLFTDFEPAEAWLDGLTASMKRVA
jgi:hypothetical protein